MISLEIISLSEKLGELSNKLKDSISLEDPSADKKMDAWEKLMDADEKLIEAAKILVDQEAQRDRMAMFVFGDCIQYVHSGAFEGDGQKRANTLQHPNHYQECLWIDTANYRHLLVMDYRCS